MDDSLWVERMSQVADKVFGLVDLVAGGCDTLSDLTTSSGLTRSTTHRLLASLVGHGYLSYSSVSRRYQLGYHLLELGEKKRRSFGFLDAIRPTLLKYGELSKDTIHVAVLDKNDIVLIECIPGKRQLQIQSFAGQRAVAYTASVGKALIGRKARDTWKGYLKSIPAEYPKSQAQLVEDFAVAQRENYAIDRDECSIGTCGIASAFRVVDGMNAAISINGATVYFSDERMASLVPMVRSAAAEIETIIREAQFRQPPAAVL